MNGIIKTRFGDFDDPVKMTKQMATAINKIELALQGLPLFSGENDPNGEILAPSGSIYIRKGQQGLNATNARANIYVKLSDNGSNDWLALLYLGSQEQTTLNAFRGSLYIKIPSELTLSAAIYLKTTDDATPTGWTAL